MAHKHCGTIILKEDGTVLANPEPADITYKWQRFISVDEAVMWFAKESRCI